MTESMHPESVYEDSLANWQQQLGKDLPESANLYASSHCSVASG